MNIKHRRRFGERPSVRKTAFTLIELLVVVAIISLLVAILLPSLKKANRLAKLAVELSNMRQVGLAVQLYGADNEYALPGGTSAGPGGHGPVRQLLYTDEYLSGGEDVSPNSTPNWTSAVWGCLLAKDRRLSVWNHPGTWHWGVCVRPTVNEEGTAQVWADCGEWNDGLDDNAFLDGRGWHASKDGYGNLGAPYAGPASGIVLLRDAGEMDRRLVPGASDAPYQLTGHMHNPWPAYDSSVLPTETASLMLGGHARLRSPDEMRSTFYDGCLSWR